MKQTIINLARAFVGESQARTRYTFYATIARNDGYEQIAAIFTETADQEKSHAKRLFEHLKKLTKGKTPSIDLKISVPLIIGKTAENLQASINGETHEYKKMYPAFAKTAEKEGFKALAFRFLSIAKAEAHHAERYKKLLDLLKSGKLFKRDKKTVWICRECGYVHISTTPPIKCPSCDHPAAFYQVKSENY